VSQYPVRGLRAGQDSSSESGDKGAVLALDIVTNSGDWFLIDELAAEGVAGHAGVGGGHARGPSDRRGSRTPRLRIPANERPPGMTGAARIAETPREERIGRQTIHRRFPHFVHAP
jgi:hypothetical protein